MSITVRGIEFQANDNNAMGLEFVNLRITADDLEKACGHAIRPHDVLIINTGWHKQYEDGDYFPYCPGLVSSAAHWMVDKQIKVVGHDTQANDHPLATAIGPQRNGPILPHLEQEYLEWSGGTPWEVDFPEWEPVHNILFKNGTFEKVYVVLEGEMTVEWDGNAEVLRAMDSCTVPAGQVRRIENRSNHVCKMLVVIPYPEGGRPS